MDQELSIQKNRVRKKKRKKKIFNFKILKLSAIPVPLRITITAFLLITLFLLLQSWTYRLNLEIKSLQEELNTIQAEVDDKDGKLHSSTNLKEIEAQARSYGMREATNDQYIYESAAKKQTVLPDTSVGLLDYLNFFTQYRDEFLWAPSE